MTKEFDKYIKTILEYSSFNDLPNEAPYGFWIAPNGDFFPVKWQQHMQVGFDIAKNYIKLPVEKMDSNTLYSELGKRKFVKVVASVDSRRKVFLVDAFYYQYAGYFGDVEDEPYYKVSFDITNSTKRTLNDIGQVYDYEIEYNKS